MKTRLQLAAFVLLLATCKRGDTGATGGTPSAADASPTGSASFVLAQEGSFPAPGTELVQVNSAGMTGGTFAMESSGQTKKGPCDTKETSRETLEFLSRDRVRVTISEGGFTRKVSLDGKEGTPETHPNPLLRMPVIFTRDGDIWKAEFESGAVPDPDQKAVLDRKIHGMNSRKDTATYGTSPRRIGDTWRVEGTNLPFAEDTGAAKGGWDVTFKAVEEHDGRKCALLTGPLDLTDRTADGTEIHLRGDVVVLRSIEDRIDVEFSFAGTIRLSGTAVTIEGPMVMHGTTTIR